MKNNTSCTVSKGKLEESIRVLSNEVVSVYNQIELFKRHGDDIIELIMLKDALTTAIECMNGVVNEKTQL